MDWCYLGNPIMLGIGGDAMVDIKSPVESCDLIIKGEHEAVVYCHRCGKDTAFEGDAVVKRAKKDILTNHTACKIKADLEEVSNG